MKYYLFENNIRRVRIENFLSLAYVIFKNSDLVATISWKILNEDNNPSLNARKMYRLYESLYSREQDPRG